ncbi:MAG TPA: fatty acid--CoA ligase family protein [Usitatibacteraceae bacterium]|nr:fatty acid--CoA ligase family protein [Usitatibacteraceae bacterium]
MPIDAIFARARRTPEHAALIQNGEAWSYGAFARAIAQARSQLEGAGLRPGGLVAMAVVRPIDAWAGSFALRSLGFTTAMIERSTDVPSLDLRNVSGVVVADERPHEAAESLARSARCPVALLPAARHFGLSQGPVPAAPALAEGGMAGHVMLTSGTTGTFKKVLRSPRVDEELVRSLASLFGMTESSVVYLGNFPAWTAGGYRWPRAAWSRGGTVVYEDPPWSYRPFGELALTHAFATPATLAVLLDAPEGAIRHDDALKLVVTAGALPKSLAERARKRITRKLYSAYASTEASMVTMTLVENDEDLHWHRPVDPTAVQVVDEAGRVLPAGETGLVRVRVSPGIDGYLDDEATTREFFRDGWFHPGDLGRLRADGRLCLEGRATDVINLMGAKIATGPAERSLQDLLGAEGVCVFTQGEGDAQELHVAIQSRSPVDRDTLAAFARRELAAFPRVHFHVLAELPRNAMGKVRRLDLRRQLLGGPA